MKPTYFKSQDEFRKWLLQNHDKKTELWLGMYRKDTGKAGISYKEAVDEALCFGWIDGIRKRFDDHSFVQRFTPRKPRSIWSAINIKRVAELKKLGRMHEAGARVFANRDLKQQNKYSFEQQQHPELTAAQQKIFKKDKKAWAHWQKMPPYYRKTASWYVISAKQEATQARRLEWVISHAARGERIPQLVSPSNRKK